MNANRNIPLPPGRELEFGLDSMPPLPDSKHVARTGDPDLESVEVEGELEAIQPALRAYIGSLIGSIAEISDIVQEANLLIWHRRHDYQPGTNFKAYAFRVAYYKVMSFRRDQARWRRRFFSESLTFELAAEAQDLFERDADSRMNALAACVKLLPAEHQTLLKDHYADQVSLTDIASRTRRNPSALHKTISRIRLALRHCINKRLPVAQDTF